MSRDRFCIVELRDHLRVADRYHDTFATRCWALAFAAAPAAALLTLAVGLGVIR